MQTHRGCPCTFMQCRAGESERVVAVYCLRCHCAHPKGLSLHSESNHSSAHTRMHRENEHAPFACACVRVCECALVCVRACVRTLVNVNKYALQRAGVGGLAFASVHACTSRKESFNALVHTSRLKACTCRRITGHVQTCICIAGVHAHARKSQDAGKHVFAQQACEYAQELHVHARLDVAICFVCAGNT